MRRIAVTPVALVAALISVGLMLFAGRHNSSWLPLVLIAMWVVAPYAAVIAATAMAKRWPERSQRRLRAVALMVVVGSVVAYGADAIRPFRPQAAFPFVVVPAVSWLLVLVGALVAWRTAARIQRD